mgnify:CR=1 FL=1
MPMYNDSVQWRLASWAALSMCIGGIEVVIHVLKPLVNIHSLIDLLVFTTLADINSFPANILGVIALSVLGLLVVAL